MIVYNHLILFKAKSAQKYLLILKQLKAGKYERII